MAALLCFLAFAAAADTVSVIPPSPDPTAPISFRVAGVSPVSTPIYFYTYTINGPLVRVEGCIPPGFEVGSNYAFTINIGTLSAGAYSVEYYTEYCGPPGQPGSPTGPQTLRASLKFSVGPAIAGSPIPTYAATRIPQSYAGFAINSAGQVAGYTASRAFLYSGGTLTDLGTLGGNLSIGYGINSSAQVSGLSQLPGGTGTTHAVLFANGVIRDLGTLGGSDSWGRAINDSGQIAGYSKIDSTDAYHAFLYSGGVMRDLGTLGGSYSYATGINNNGQIVGTGGTPSEDTYHAFIYSNGTMKDLGTPGEGSFGHGINATGQATGEISFADQTRHAFLYSGGMMQDLGTLGGASSSGLGINSKGQVVGSADTAFGFRNSHAFLYSGGTMYDLNSIVLSGLVGSVLTAATAINDEGQIVANSCTPPAFDLLPPDCVAFLLEPTVFPPSSTNYQGLWWKPTESGWGLNFAHQGDQIFATWFTYDAAGKPWWLSMLASRYPLGSNTYTGPIYVNSGPPFYNYVGGAMATNDGIGSVMFADPNNALFTYSITNGNVTQTKFVTRYDLGGAQPNCVYSANPDFDAATNYQDLWWVSTESGWGVNFAHQATQIYATWYTYGTDRAPLWLSSLMRQQGTTNVYSGPLYETSGPHFYDYRTADLGPVLTVGTATATFVDGNHATFGYSTNGSGGLPVVSQTKAISRFIFAAPAGTVCH